VKPKIKVAFLSGTPELNRALIEQTRAIFPELPLSVVSDFPPEDPSLKWIRYRQNQSLRENYGRCREALRGHQIRIAAVMLVPNVPFRRMRLLALLLSPRGWMGFNENLHHFMLRPNQIPPITRYLVWRMKNLVRWLGRARFDWRLELTRAAARLRFRRAASRGLIPQTKLPGISVVIPSRTGRELLAAHLPAIVAERPGEIIVVDNGSTDDTAGWLTAEYPEIRVEVSETPLAFARAVNRGIAAARYSRVCLLNNDMGIEPGLFRALAAAFDRVPDLFCATAEILFPTGVRREETGKTVFAPAAGEFPVRCDEPLPGEDLSYVLYGSGGCSLYDAAKLAMLGNVNEVYEPAYVEDLDLGWRAWQRGWPSVYVADAVVEHRHRTTTSRYFTQAELDEMLRRNYLRFLAGAVSEPGLFRKLWREAPGYPRGAASIALAGGPTDRPDYAEESFTGLCSGAVSVFPGRPPTARMRILVASPYLPFPLSHGGAVRMYNLMRRAAEQFDLILVAFTEQHAPPPRELLDICIETVLVRRPGTHEAPSRGRPEVVEEFDSPAYHAALHQTVQKWRPAVAQLEFTQMAQYAADCTPARTVLVEHDVTFDLYEQLVQLEAPLPNGRASRSGSEAAAAPLSEPLLEARPSGSGAWDLRRERELWQRFEVDAWSRVDRVVVMSEKDRAIAGARAVVVPNGVDIERFRPASTPPEARRLLFIGSFAHLPNRMALEWFMAQVWPLLHDISLHIIAGARHDQWTLAADLRQPGIELEGFVSDVRPAYERAALVVAPLVASAGTNIKVLEAMAMGKAVVSTAAGVNGLDIEAGRDFVLVKNAEEMRTSIERLLGDAAARKEIELAARARVELEFSWDRIAKVAHALLRAASSPISTLPEIDRQTSRGVE
jgi:GT2 family glycosyltransferase/glycosyltransferase involved in cell wall biosynthesis